jgi:hypothetical protein
MRRTEVTVHGARFDEIVRLEEIHRERDFRSFCHFQEKEVEEGTRGTGSDDCNVNTIVQLRLEDSTSCCL